jgi:hypothetical protein
MTAASKLKRAAVVEVRSELERKTNGKKASKKIGKIAVKEAAKEVKAQIGSTTATATKQVAFLAQANARLSIKESATSGSTAATKSTAASMQATRLPVAIFPTNSPLFLTSQQNPVLSRAVVPERFVRVRRAA